jgi:peptidyl-prolyl cis-trans isomerase B (cyclophilin B)
LNFRLFTIGIFLLILASSIPLIFADSKVAVIETKFGNIVIEFFPNDAPKTVANFQNLTENGFYDGTKFHRIIPNFMVQGGDPLTKDNDLIQRWGTGGSNSTIVAEFNSIKHLRGIVSMARSIDPNSASSQFFIVHQNSTYLDKQYTVFGRIITQESYDVLDSKANLETNKNTTSGIPRDVPIDLESAQIQSVKIKNLSEIHNVLNLGEPERIVSHSTFENGIYANTLLEFSFKAPEGWTLQEPQKLQPGTPDVVIIGTKTDDFNSVIAFLIEYKNQTSLDQYVKESRKNLQTLIDAGRLEILSDKNDKIKGFNAQVTEAKGGFTAGEKIYIIKYKELVLETNNKFYTITYTNEEKDFDSDLVALNNVLDSLEIASEGKTDVPISDLGSETNIDMNTVAIGVGIGIAVAVAIVIVFKLKKKSPAQKPEQSN